MALLSRDRDWIRKSFMVQGSDYTQRVDRQNRFLSTNQLKFTDTTPGGNIYINTPPQFTRFADPRPESGGKSWSNRYGRQGVSQGLGRYYSEAIDDQAQVIHMRFGVPQFNSMVNFFTGFYSTDAGRIARTGRADGFFYNLGKAAGFVVAVLNFKLLAVAFVASALGQGLRWALKKPSSRFYNMKPTMPVYWNAVQTMVNHIAVNEGIVPRLGDPEVARRIGNNYQFTAAEQAKLKALLPDIFNDSGSVNVFAMANKAKRLERRRDKALARAFNNANFDLNKKIQEIYNEPISDPGSSWERYMSSWFGSAMSKPQVGGSSAPEGAKAPDPSGEVASRNEKDNAGFGEFLQAEFDDGASFVSFKVDATGEMTDSFSSTVGESDIQNKINGISSSARSAVFSTAAGNIDGGLIDGVMQAAKDFAQGALDTVQLSGLVALAGSALVDIPKHWQSSTAQLARANYTVVLRTPYNNPISRLLHKHIPLAMLLCGALPLSTGKQSYTSPFLVELYDKGRCQTRLGMIDSMTVTRGKGNTGWTSDGFATGIEVNFSIVDLTSILHMPISEGFSLSATQAGIDIGTTVGGAGGAIAGGIPGAVAGAAGGAAAGAAIGAGVDAVKGAVNTVLGIFDDETAFSDYMAVLASQGLADQIYPWQRFKLNLTQKMANIDSWFSPAQFASFAGDTLPGQLVSALYRGTSRDMLRDPNW